MRFSQSTELAADSLLFMAAHPEKPGFSVEELAAAQHVSGSYLAKVFQQLVKASLLNSQRGARGGYSLARPPERITLLDIARVFEGSAPMYRCQAPARLCRLGSHCLILDAFREAEARLNEVLEGVTLADLLTRLKANSELAPWAARHAEPAPVAEAPAGVGAA
jgi:Rrf2 family protein